MRFNCLILVAVVDACGGHDHEMVDGPGGGPSGASLKARLDLTGVIGLAIKKSTSPRLVGDPAPAPIIAAGDCMPSNLLAVQANGDMVTTSVTETPAMGDAGAMCNTMMSTESASAIFDTKNYDVITYMPALAVSAANDGGASLSCPSVILRKSDGALYCGPDVSANASCTGDFCQTVKGDGDKLIIGPKNLTRLDMSANPPQATVVNNEMTTGQMIGGFNANAASDVLADGMTMGTSGSWLRIYKASGGLMSILGNQMTGSTHWYAHASDTFYYATHPLNSPINTYQLAPGTFAGTLVGAYQGGIKNGGGGFTPALVTNTQAYVVQSDNVGKSGIVEMLPSAAGRVCTAMGITSGTVTACTGDADCTGVCSSSTSRCVGGVYDGMMCGTGTTIDCTSTCQLGGATHLMTGVYSITKAVGAGTTLFLVGNDMSGNSFVDAVDTTQIGEAACASTPSSALDGGCESSPITPTVLLAPGDYSLGPTTLSSSGELTFIGVRFSDGASVVGNCTATACTVLSATAPAVSTLVRIN